MAKTCKIYFKQGAEMLSASKSIPETSSPLVEYYGYLQCVKGVVLSVMDLNTKFFFKQHGITKNPSNNNSSYIDIKIQQYGVFQALILHYGSENLLNRYLSANYTISLEELIENSYQNYVGDAVRAYIGLWMFSSMVRYEPNKLLQILDGEKDDLSWKIKRFREIFVPDSINQLLNSIYTSPKLETLIMKENTKW